MQLTYRDQIGFKNAHGEDINSVNFFWSDEYGKPTGAIDKDSEVFFIDKTYKKMEFTKDNVCFVISYDILNTFSPFWDDLFLLLKYRAIIYNDGYVCLSGSIKEYKANDNERKDRFFVTY